MSPEILVNYGISFQMLIWFRLTIVVIVLQFYSIYFYISYSRTACLLHVPLWHLAWVDRMKRAAIPRGCVKWKVEKTALVARKKSNKCVLTAAMERQDGKRLRTLDFDSIPKKRIFTLLLLIFRVPDGGSAAAKCAMRTSCAAACSAKIWRNLICLLHFASVPEKVRRCVTRAWSTSMPHQKLQNDTRNIHRTIRNIKLWSNFAVWPRQVNLDPRPPWTGMLAARSPGPKLCRGITVPNALPTKSWRSSVSSFERTRKLMFSLIPVQRIKNGRWQLHLAKREDLLICNALAFTTIFQWELWNTPFARNMTTFWTPNKLITTPLKLKRLSPVLLRCRHRHLVVTCVALPPVTEKGMAEIFVEKFEERKIGPSN